MKLPTKLPLLSADELIRLLKKNFKHSDGRATVVPVHSGRDIGRGLLRKIIREIDVDREEFLKYL
ncbi:type II toxin-antitoxin system HicA family toxin [Candidatus Woesearchaeota archaeon]|nr:type II toxin-antitoxin system HicA family toxin [Candidatus Woesearchaeota archaeon]